MKLSAICDVQSGYTARTRLNPTSKGGVPAVQLRDLQGEDDFDPAEASQYALGPSFERYWAGAGDVLFRSRGERNTAVSVAPDSKGAAVAILPLIVLRPDPSLADGRYIAWYINQRPAQLHFDKYARGTRLRMIPKGCLDSLEVPLPDLATQQRIVEVDALAKREDALMIDLAQKKKLFTSFVLLEQVRKAQPHGNGAGQSAARQIKNPAGKSKRTNL
ncbi:restriction endonuclease subunit S [uncultured Ruegeria sp.]|uniref:restriction endonuclease subunit S n=1 Tax=uncultured Ruegeria sp. TaxID=259304 RepID=UPI0026022D32|nr:restriction endonuclease subunit S [uncultured Ruegeria sp.]